MCSTASMRRLASGALASGRKGRSALLGLGLCALSWLQVGRAAAQISPPGLGEGQTASWEALGLRQDLDAARRVSSLGYIGVGSISDPDEPNAFHKLAILVVNEEVTQRVREHFWYAVALSYRRQNEYEHTPPFRPAAISPRHELRLYARASYVLAWDSIKLTHTLRPELRSFFAPHSEDEEARLQLRLRLRAQLAFGLDRDGQRRILASAEALGSIAQSHAPAGWGNFGYRESRFCLYYSHRLERAPLTLDVGYMHNLLGRGTPHSVHYVAVDLVWDDPFGVRKD